MEECLGLRVDLQAEKAVGSAQHVLCVCKRTTAGERWDLREALCCLCNNATVQ